MTGTPAPLCYLGRPGHTGPRVATPEAAATGTAEASRRRSPSIRTGGAGTALPPARCKQLAAGRIVGGVLSTSVAGLRMQDMSLPPPIWRAATWDDPTAASEDDRPGLGLRRRCARGDSRRVRFVRPASPRAWTPAIRPALLSRGPLTWRVDPCGPAPTAGKRTRIVSGSAVSAAPRSSPALPAQEVRKTVTIVFSDLESSTALGGEHRPRVAPRDHEPLLRRDAGVLERHGGVVEKYIGDAIMAVFGLPGCTRTTRCVPCGPPPTCSALGRLNEELEADWGVRLANRTGVNTGEVVAGRPGRRPAARHRRRRQRRGETRAGRTRDAGRSSASDLPARPGRGRRRGADAAEPEGEERAGARRTGCSPCETERGCCEPGGPRSSAGRPRRPAWSGSSSASSRRGRRPRHGAGRGRASASRGWWTSSPGTSRTGRRCCVDGAWRTGGASRSGRWWRSSGRPPGSVRTDPPAMAGAKLGASFEERRGRGRGRSRRLGDRSVRPPFPVEEVYWGTRKLFERLAGAGPSSWSSRTSTGPSRSSRSHRARSRTPRRTRRSCSSASPARSCPNVARVGWSGPTPKSSPRAALRGADRSGPRQPARRRRPGRRRPYRDRRRVGRQPAVRRAAAVDAHRRRLPAPGERPLGADGRRPHARACRPTIDALLSARLDLLAREERAVIEPASVVGGVFQLERSAPWSTTRSGELVPAHLRALEGKQLIKPEQSPRRGRGPVVPVPPHPDPRRRVPGSAQAEAGGAARALRRLAGGGERGAAPQRRVRGDRRLPPRAGAPLPVGAGSAGRPWPRPRRCERRAGSAPPAAARSRGRTCPRPPTCCGAP